MSAIDFAYPPSPHILQWLSAGQLANRLQRSLRLWVLLTQLYGSESDWKNSLPQKFSYPDLRDRLFADNHPQKDHLSAKELHCHNRSCICHKAFKEWIFTDNHQSHLEWQQEIIHLTGLSANELDKELQKYPFATVHRSIRDDLKFLSLMAWLKTVGRGQYQLCPAKELPSPPIQISPELSFTELSVPQTWELLRVLESVAFVQPNLEIVISSLWEKLALTTTAKGPLGTAPEQRIFIHFDYILNQEMQDRVDNYQEQLEQLWRQPSGGVVQLEYWINEGDSVKVIVYPVCLHYSRRAKYLSAYGIDPSGKLAWHNYRLDRIASDRLTVLAWGDPDVPKDLKTMWHIGKLPTPTAIQTELNIAWGFNFYLKPELLILRFPATFARWYVDNTERHPTFQSVDYQQLSGLINKEIKDVQECQQLLQILTQRSPADAYYRAWIRSGDINVLMRLRDWRPNGEVIAPLSIRQRLAKEATEELSHYQTLLNPI